MTEEQFAILIRIDEKTESLVEGQKDQEERIRKLEKFRNWASGLAASIMGAAGITQHLK